MADVRIDLAKDLFERGFELQQQGELEIAADMYRRSIETWPTAEAYTFLGWTYRYQGRVEDAITECKKAIEIDPTYGNPYNDIGAYLLELGRPEDAIPWLESAISSGRYDAYHYPWYNLGRAHLAIEMFTRARECFEKAIEIDPCFGFAAEALAKVKRMVQ